MWTLSKILSTALISFILILLTGCPGNDAPEEPENAYHIGTWAGNIQTNARLVLRQETSYWNAAWNIEANIQLDEYDDGSLVGEAQVQLFYWNTDSELILSYEDIAQGKWDQYINFEIQLTGEIDSEGYKLSALDLPLTLPDPNDPSQQIEFWDFLFPVELEGEWPLDNVMVMEGDSMRVQGEDYEETRRLSSFREFFIQYIWEIRKL